MRPRGRERVEVGESGHRVTILEDGFGRGEQRDEQEEAQGKEEEEVAGRGGHGVGGDGGRRRGCWGARDGESCGLRECLSGVWSWSSPLVERDVRQDERLPETPLPVLLYKETGLE